jgi:hypothetical protein
MKTVDELMDELIGIVAELKVARKRSRYAELSETLPFIPTPPVTEGNRSTPHWERRNPFRKDGTYSDRAGLDRFVGFKDFRMRIMDHKQNIEVEIGDLPHRVRVERRMLIGSIYDRKDYRKLVGEGIEVRKEDLKIQRVDPELEKVETSKTEQRSRDRRHTVFGGRTDRRENNAATINIRNGMVTQDDRRHYEFENEVVRRKGDRRAHMESFKRGASKNTVETTMEGTPINTVEKYGSAEYQINRRKAVVTGRRQNDNERRDSTCNASGEYRRIDGNDRRTQLRRRDDINITTTAQPREPQFYGELILDPPTEPPKYKGEV